MQKSNFSVTLELKRFFFPSERLTAVLCFFSVIQKRGVALSSSWQLHPPPIFYFYSFFYLIQDSNLSWLHCLRLLWQRNRKLINAALSPSLHLEARVPVMLGPMPTWERVTPQGQRPCGLPPVCCVSVPGQTCFRSFCDSFVLPPVSHIFPISAVESAGVFG